MDYEVWIERKLEGSETGATFDTISSIWPTRAQANIEIEILKAKGIRAWIEVDADSLFDDDFNDDDFDVSDFAFLYKDLP